jgi:hypothetical protein
LYLKPAGFSFPDEMLAKKPAAADHEDVGQRPPDA